MFQDNEVVVGFLVVCKPHPVNISKIGRIIKAFFMIYEIRV
jgi:hypothetical protein